NELLAAPASSAWMLDHFGFKGTAARTDSCSSLTVGRSAGTATGASVGRLSEHAAHASARSAGIRNLRMPITLLRCLTPELSRAAKRHRLERIVRAQPAE